MRVEHSSLELYGSYNAKLMKETDSFTFNNLPKMLLQNIRQEANQIAYCLYPEVTDVRF